MFSFRINDVAKNHYMQLFSTVPIGMMMTKEKFNSLPKNVQALIKKYSGKWIDDLFVKTTTAQQDKLMDDHQGRQEPHALSSPTRPTRQPTTRSWKRSSTNGPGSNKKRQDILAVVKDELKKLRAGK